MSVISDLTTTYKNPASIPGWIIAGAGFMGYALSETKIIGPIWTIILAIAGLTQLAYYTASTNAI